MNSSDEIIDIKTYQGKDKRFRSVVTYADNHKEFKSYPKVLMEIKLGRRLLPEEDVHHIDGDFTNNHINNLEIKLHGEHQKEHSTKYFDTVETCIICGCNFIMTGPKWARFYSDLSRKTLTVSRILTCSRSCAGKAGSGKYPFLYKMDERLAELEQFWKK